MPTSTQSDFRDYLTREEPNCPNRRVRNRMHGGVGGRGCKVPSYPDSLNNLCGDKIVLSWQDTGNRIQQDWACFAPNPPKDLILKRSGNLLAQTQIHDNGPHGCPPRFEAIPHDAIENTLKYFDVRNPNAANNLTRSEWAKLTWTKVDANNRQEAAELCLAGWMRHDEDDCEFGSEEYIVYVRDEVGHIFKCDVRMTKTVIYQCLLDKPITVCFSNE